MLLGIGHSKLKIIIIIIIIISKQLLLLRTALTIRTKKVFGMN